MVLAGELRLPELLWPLQLSVPVRTYEEEPNFIRKYKTALCKHWETGLCPFGLACTFAHGLEELRDKPQVTQTKRSKRKKTPLPAEVSAAALTAKRRLPVFEAIEARGEA